MHNTRFTAIYSAVYSGVQYTVYTVHSAQCTAHIRFTAIYSAVYSGRYYTLNTAHCTLQCTRSRSVGCRSRVATERGELAGHLFLLLLLAIIGT